MAAPTVRLVSWISMVDAVEKDRYKPETAYRFSNDRKFDGTDKSNGGIYDDEFPYRLTFTLA